MSFVLLYWREVIIALLAGSCLFSVRACNSAHDKAIQIQAEDAALAEQAKAESEQKQANDKREYDDAKHDLQKQIDSLNADHRVASVQCVRHSTTSPRTVPPTASTTRRGDAEEPVNIPQPPTFDPGPQLDALMRECDELAARHNSLVDWIMGTR